MIETRELTSLHFNRRPSGTIIDTIVIHSMYAKGFPDPFCPKNCWQMLNDHEVSAHFFVARDGMIYQSVPVRARAWHAGASKMPFPKDPRSNVNDFSVGIEVIGDEKAPFTENQYSSLKKLCLSLSSKLPIYAIVSHRAIAPERKNDPWPNFDWSRFKNDLPRNFKVSD